MTGKNRMVSEDVKFLRTLFSITFHKDGKKICYVWIMRLWQPVRKTLQDQGAIFEECIDRMRQVI